MRRSNSVLGSQLAKLAVVAILLATVGAVAIAQQGFSRDTGDDADFSLRPAGGAPMSAARIWNEQLLDAIRIDTPRPTVHSRNLFHLSIAMWDSWAAYNPDAPGYLVDEAAVSADVAAARAEAISFAAYRLLKHRFQVGPGAADSQVAFDQKMDALGYDLSFTSTLGETPAELGNRIAEAVIAFGLTDGANELNDYVDDSGYSPVNQALVFELPGVQMNDPNRWQPLAFSHLILQNGIVIGTAVQEFLGPNWGQVTPFGLTPEDMSFPYVYFDPGMPPQLGGVGDELIKTNAVQNIMFSSWVDPTDDVSIDISPGVFHNNTLGTEDGSGYPLNPYTGQPYAPNVVKRADYARVLAEFWADGPDSETPPGHWNTVANYVADHPLVEKRIGGQGPLVNDLEWDVKVYLALNGAVHDAAVAAWGIKGYYDYSRPICHIRYMGGLGQSSNPAGLSYHPDGLPLVPNLIEVITFDSILPGERHAHLADHVGEIAIRAWLGNPTDPAAEIGGVGWLRAIEWLPYQRDTFVTPPFAGYISGHSTFSRAGAEVLTEITGTPYFPGGLGTFVAPQNDFLRFETGPTETVVLEWATYYDAADEAGVSRLYGGIHPAVDDFPGRIIGSAIGKRAYETALPFILQETDSGSCSDDDSDESSDDSSSEDSGSGKSGSSGSGKSGSGSSGSGKSGSGSSDSGSSGSSSSGSGAGPKVLVCHGNPANQHEICVSQNAVDAHLAHGDSLGDCIEEGSGSDDDDSSSSSDDSSSGSGGRGDHDAPQVQSPYVSGDGNAWGLGRSSGTEGPSVQSPEDDTSFDTPATRLRAARGQEKRIVNQLISAVNSGSRSVRAESREALLVALGQTRDTATRLRVVQGLVDQVDPSIHGLLIETLKDVQAEAQAQGQPSLVQSALRLQRRLENQRNE